MSARQSEAGCADRFREGLRAHRLLLQYDAASGRYQFYPRPLSLFSDGAAPEWREARGTGRLVAFSLCHTPAPGFGDAVPYMVGLVRLDEGPLVFAPIADVRGGGLAVGQAMRIAWRGCGDDGVPRFAFEPA